MTEFVDCKSCEDMKCGDDCPAPIEVRKCELCNCEITEDMKKGEDFDEVEALTNNALYVNGLVCSSCAYDYEVAKGAIDQEDYYEIR